MSRPAYLAPPKPPSYNQQVPTVPVPPTVERSMTRKFLLKMSLIVSALAAALILTVTRPSPQGLVPFGVGQAEVRAAPGVAAAKARSGYDLAALKEINWAIVHIRDMYVDPQRIDAKAM